MFAERLKAIRANKGISQRKLAEKLFITQQAIAKWEKGITSPSPEMVAKLADFFDVTADYLLGLNDDIPKRQTKNAPTEYNLNEGERTLIQLFRNIPEEHQRIVLQMVQAAINNQQ